MILPIHHDGRDPPLPKGLHLAAVLFQTADDESVDSGIGNRFEHRSSQRRHEEHRAPLPLADRADPLEEHRVIGVLESAIDLLRQENAEGVRATGP
ncbi:Uncharacterised protein [Chlamydia trachomatis]|nr:Uncharacterised protein [Chlamydia trachomatis]